MDIRVLPYAWATIISQSELGSGELMKKDIQSQDFLVTSLNGSKFILLKAGHAATQQLATQYGIRFKEGRILRGILTIEESHRFHIATYLFLHYQTIWSGFQDYAFKVFQPDFDDLETREDAVQDAKTLDACDSFLASLSTNELLWIQDFSEFLLHDIDCTLNLKQDPNYFGRFGFKARNSVNLSLDTWRHFLLSTSVAYLGHWEHIFMHTGHAPTHLQRKELWLVDALYRVLRERELPTQAKVERILQLVSIHQHSDSCSL